ARLPGAGAGMELVLTLAGDRDLAAPAARGDRAPRLAGHAGQPRVELVEIAVEGDLDPRPGALEGREIAPGGGPALARKPCIGRCPVLDLEAHRQRLAGEGDPVPRALDRGRPHPVLLGAGQLGEVEAPDPRSAASRAL